jgi:hypothetical protein
MSFLRHREISLVNRKRHAPFGTTSPSTTANTDRVGIWGLADHLIELFIADPVGNRANWHEPPTLRPAKFTPGVPQKRNRKRHPDTK